MKALIVEDEPATRLLLAESLRCFQYDVIEASNGQEGLDLIRREQCRLVVSDWNMPGMDGVELCRAVRAEMLDGYVYFLLLTSRSETRDIIDAFSAGVDDYVCKPFEPAELGARLRTACRLLSLETRDVAIFAMAKLAESRDPETGAHLERVRSYAKLLALQLSQDGPYQEEINSEFVRLIVLTCPLHDIGKVSIPDHVLLKPSRLDDREFEIMKSHAQAGADTLAKAMKQFPNALFLRMAWEIAGSHHERWDGKGYPQGLAGEAIPLAARIFAMADVYDALSSRRVYKDAFGHDVTRGIIVKGSGEQFDPAVVDAFLAVEQKFVDVRQCYAKEEADLYEDADVA